MPVTARASPWASARDAGRGFGGRIEARGRLVEAFFARNENREDRRNTGNQQGGFDARYAAQLVGVDLAVYGQVVGEDEAGGLPGKYAGLADASWRLGIEYADSAAGLKGPAPVFGRLLQPPRLSVGAALPRSLPGAEPGQRQPSGHAVGVGHRRARPGCGAWLGTGRSSTGTGVRAATG